MFAEIFFLVSVSTKMMSHIKIIFVFLKGPSLNHELCVDVANRVPFSPASTHCSVRCKLADDGEGGTLFTMPTQCS
jgi:hypothetical protein